MADPLCSSIYIVVLGLGRLSGMDSPINHPLEILQLSGFTSKITCVILNYTCNSVRTHAMTKQQAGQIGGRVTVSKYGRSHMQAIGKRGATVTWTRYSMKPIGQSQYAMVHKETNVIKAIIGVWTP